MATTPARPKIYHITHVDNLSRISTDGGLLSDRMIADRGGPTRAVGMSGIKARRLYELPVSCHPGTMVGEYVPFFFCPRSVMLYVLHRGNHPELSYREGQEPIVHLEADLYAVIRWAERNGVRWAFSLSNAGARYTEFRSRIEDLGDLDWGAIGATDFRPAHVKEGKQAEFLLCERLPFDLVERIGVSSAAMQSRAARAITGAVTRLVIDVRREWYF